MIYSLDYLTDIPSADAGLDTLLYSDPDYHYTAGL